MLTGTQRRITQRAAPLRSSSSQRTLARVPAGTSGCWLRGRPRSNTARCPDRGARTRRIPAPQQCPSMMALFCLTEVVRGAARVGLYLRLSEPHQKVVVAVKTAPPRDTGCGAGQMLGIVAVVTFVMAGSTQMTRWTCGQDICGCRNVWHEDMVGRMMGDARLGYRSWGCRGSCRRAGRLHSADRCFSEII